MIELATKGTQTLRTDEITPGKVCVPLWLIYAFLLKEFSSKKINPT